MAEMNDDQPTHGTLETWDHMFRNLYERAGFHDWWDGIEPDIKEEIRQAMLEILARREKHIVQINAGILTERLRRRETEIERYRVALRGFLRRIPRTAASTHITPRQCR